MTRINCIEPERLTDQHLFAEYRELPRTFRIARALAPAEQIPAYRLGAGHLKFFFDKTGFLAQRQAALIEECLRRGISINYRIAPTPVTGLDNGWEPSSEDMEINLVRLRTRLRAKPGFYRFRGKLVKPDFYDRPSDK